MGRVAIPKRGKRPGKNEAGEKNAGRRPRCFTLRPRAGSPAETGQAHAHDPLVLRTAAGHPDGIPHSGVHEPNSTKAPSRLANVATSLPSVVLIAMFQPRPSSVP